MRLTIDDIISEIYDMDEDKVTTLYQLYNELIVTNDDAVKLICKMLSHFSKSDKEYLEKIKSHIEKIESLDICDPNHPFNGIKTVY